MTSFIYPYTGQTINPSPVGYESLTISADTVLEWPINGNVADVVANIIEVTATAVGLKLIMPPATQVSVGQSALISNVGANTFSVVGAGGNAIVSIAPGVAQYVYVTDNTTVNGVWAAVTFGAATSFADAAQLAGYGLKAASSKLNTVTPPSTFSSNYTFSAADQSSLYVWVGGAGVATLPVAAALPNGFYVIVKNDGAGILNILPSGGDTIDGNANKQLQIDESLVLVATQTGWYSYAYGRSSQFAFTLLLKNVTGGTVTLTAAEAANNIQEYQGVLSSNCEIIVPPTVQLYSFANYTSGPFSLTFTTGIPGGASIALPTGQTVIAICDGTNVYNSQTSTSSFAPAFVIGNGSASNPSLAFLSSPTTGLYQPTSNQIGFSINGTAAGAITSSGMRLTVGIAAGAF